MFEVQFVNSTAIHLIAFKDGCLRVLFRSGVAYDYTNVEREVFETLCSAESVGREFQAVRNAYQHQRLEGDKVQNFLMAALKVSFSERLMIADV